MFKFINFKTWGPSPNFIHFLKHDTYLLTFQSLNSCDTYIQINQWQHIQTHIHFNKWFVYQHEKERKIKYEPSRYTTSNTQRVGRRKFLPQVPKRWEEMEKEKMENLEALEMWPNRKCSKSHKSCTSRILRNKRLTYQNIKRRGEEMNVQS